LNPLDSASYSACKHVKLIQELLGNVRDTCPDIHKPSDKLVAITPLNMKKTVRIAANNKVPLREPIPLEVVAQESVVTKVYTRRPKENSREQPLVHCQIFIWDNDGSLLSLICLLSKASKTKSWYRPPIRRLSHLNFGAINHLAKNGLVRGLPKLKFAKDHLYSACAMGKSKKQSHKPKSKDTNQEKLYLLHMDLCGPMRVASINGKKYILIIMDGYSRFTWVKNIRTNNGTEFVNQTLRSYYKSVGISHETSVARSPQQNGVVERRNRTLVEAARTMLIYAKDPLFLWAEAVATACYTQNRSIIRRRHRKTPYELLHDRKPDLSYLHVYGALCYPNNDSGDLGKLQAKADIGILIGYAPKKKAYHIYN
ncbi:retrovirus-related pol polyprotein from transposon TNT 1-94, partial [Tanacetum coccineum]